MTKMNFAGGTGVGILVGSAVAMAMPRRRMTRKKAIGKALRTVGSVIENVSEAIGL